MINRLKITKNIFSSLSNPAIACVFDPNATPAITAVGIANHALLDSNAPKASITNQ